MRHDPANPKWKDRDRFILSKGHCCPILYAVMAECGYCPKDQLNTLRKLGSIYQGHPDVRFLPSLEASTGSLGEGLSLGIGMALAARLDKSPSRTFVMLGDGEIQEGQIWEAAMFAGFQQGGQSGGDRRQQSHSARRLREGHYGREPAGGKVDAASAGTPSKWKATISRALQKAFAEAAAMKEQPTRDHRAHHQRQGCVVHGEQSKVPWDGSHGRRRSPRSGRAGIGKDTADHARQNQIRIEAGLATREAFGKALAELGRVNPERGGARRRSFEIHLHC